MWLQRLWYQPNVAPFLWLLWPLQQLFIALAYWRKKRLQRSPTELTVPIWVVGNITVGGAGKTPTTAAIVRWLQQQGVEVGIITRGYGGQGPYPLAITPATPVKSAGDEPAMLAQQLQVPMVAAPNRLEAYHYLLEHYPQVKLVISDDGMQHYRLPRTLEIAVIDGVRGVGNGQRLPIGPLRESLARLTEVDLVVQNGGPEQGLFKPCFRFELQPQKWRRVTDDVEVDTPAAVTYALAGIAHPQRFFDSLSAQHIKVKQQLPFADHHQFSAQDFSQIYATTDASVVMTAKDAGKCQPFAQENWYYMPVAATFPLAFWERLQAHLDAMGIASTIAQPEGNNDVRNA